MQKMIIIKRVIGVIMLVELVMILGMITNRLIEYKDKINNIESRIVELEKGVN